MIIIIAAASGGSSSEDNSTTGSNNSSSKAGSTETIYTLTDEAPAGDLTFIVNSATKKTSVGSGYFVKTSQSGTYLIVNATVTNKGTETITIDSSFFTLTDGQGREYSSSSEGQTALSTSNGSIDFFLKQVQPSLSATGEVVFEIPKDATDLKLNVKPGLFSSKKAIINIE